MLAAINNVAGQPAKAKRQTRAPKKKQSSNDGADRALDQKGPSEFAERIHGFAWAPNSRSVAFLNVSSYWGKNPLELLGGLSGHRVPHDTIFLDVFDVRATIVTEYLIRANVPYSFTRILDWSE